MKLKFHLTRKAIHAVLILMTVALLVVEANLLFVHANYGIFAQAPNQRPAADAPAAAPAADPAPAAADSAPPAADLPASTISDAVLQRENQECVTKMRDYVEGPLDATTGKREGGTQKVFSDFINTHFKSNKLTSDLLPTAFARLRKYHDDLDLQFKNILNLRADRVAYALANEQGGCQQYIDGNIRLVESLLLDHIVDNALAKKSTRLLDKYKEINDQLEHLNYDVAEMYANFSVFSQKLPCYATQCVRAP